MLIREFSQDKVSLQKLAAISEFLLGRLEDTGGKKKIMSFESFASLAQGQQISLTPALLRQMSQQAPLNAFINDVQGDDPKTAQVIFQGADQTPPAMTVDQARNTVDTMAKRAIDIG